MKHLNQSGAVSMISVVIFSIIITIVVTAYMRTIVTQQRDALNYDLSTRAYYAAESGVQDAIRSGLNNSDECQGFDSNYNQINQSIQSDIAYTCQIIDKTPDDVTGSVGEQRSAFIKLNPSTTTGTGDWRVQVSWSRNGQLIGRDNNKLFLPKVDWVSNKYHPVMRAALVSHPKTNFNRSAIIQRVLFMNPTRVGEQGGDSTAPTLNQSGAQNPADLVTNAGCNATFNNESDYQCLRTFKLANYNFTSQNVYLHLKTVYSNTDFKINLQRCNSDSDCRNVSQTDVVATVDVTARAGDVFRRVKQTVPVTGDDYKIFNNLDAALVAGDGICKSFKVGNLASQYVPGCDPTQ